MPVHNNNKMRIENEIASGTRLFQNISEEDKVSFVNNVSEVLEQRYKGSDLNVSTGQFLNFIKEKNVPLRLYVGANPNAVKTAVHKCAGVFESTNNGNYDQKLINKLNSSITENYYQHQMYDLQNKNKGIRSYNGENYRSYRVDSVYERYESVASSDVFGPEELGYSLGSDGSDVFGPEIEMTELNAQKESQYSNPSTLSKLRKFIVEEVSLCGGAVSSQIQSSATKNDLIDMAMERNNSPSLMFDHQKSQQPENDLTLNESISLERA